MTERKILQSVEPILRDPCEEIVDFDFELEQLIDDMIETMRKNKGIGLAAPQVGVSKKIFVCEFEGDKENKLARFPLTVLVNPEIKNFSKNQRFMVEGCLSFPGIEILVKRPKEVTLKGEDRHGNEIEVKGNKLYARVLQHELDHLNQTLMVDRMQESKIIFIGTGTLGLPALELLSKDKQYKILSVITSSRKSLKNRKNTISENPIYDLAKKLNLSVTETSNINDPEMVKKIKKYKPDLGVMADFGQIVSPEILKIPKKGIINIHPSLLPKYRGSSPIQQTIFEGDAVTGVSLILTSDKMDAGGIISQAKVRLSGTETATILKNHLAEIGSTLLLNSIPYYLSKDLKPELQNESTATYTKMIKKEDGLVEQSNSAEVVERKIRAYDNWPGAYIIVNNKRIQLIASHFEENGDFVIDLVKPEGRKQMSYADFVRGYKVKLTFE